MSAAPGHPLLPRFPALAAALPVFPLARRPTPLEDAPALAAALGTGPLALKRDDLSAPDYGGNKLRKLEFLLADALARGCDTVLTFGAVGSNHALATALCARRAGLGCHAVLLDQPPTPAVAATLRYLLHAGATVHAAGDFRRAATVAAGIAAAHPGGAARLYEVTWGGSNWLGATGFVAGALELAAQCRDAGRPAPDFLYVAGGTLGTAVGLALGLRAAGLATRVVAPRTVPSGPSSGDAAASLFATTNRELHARDPSFPLFDEPLRNLELRPEFAGPGYAEPAPGEAEAIALMKDAAGVKLDVTYSGKAFTGLVADARAGRLRGRSVVFWHTYNTAPYPEAIRDADVTRLPPEFRRYVGATAG